MARTSMSEGGKVLAGEEDEHDEHEGYDDYLTIISQWIDRLHCDTDGVVPPFRPIKPSVFYNIDKRETTAEYLDRYSRNPPPELKALVFRILAEDGVYPSAEAAEAYFRRFDIEGHLKDRPMGSASQARGAALELRGQVWRKMVSAACVFFLHREPPEWRPQVIAVRGAPTWIAQFGETCMSTTLMSMFFSVFQVLVDVPALMRATTTAPARRHWIETPSQASPFVVPRLVEMISHGCVLADFDDDDDFEEVPALLLLGVTDAFKKAVMTNQSVFGPSRLRELVPPRAKTELHVFRIAGSKGTGEIADIAGPTLTLCSTWPGPSVLHVDKQWSTAHGRVLSLSFTGKKALNTEMVFEFGGWTPGLVEGSSASLAESCCLEGFSASLAESCCLEGLSRGVVATACDCECGCVASDAAFGAVKAFAAPSAPSTFVAARDGASDEEPVVVTPEAEWPFASDRASTQLPILEVDPKSLAVLEISCLPAEGPACSWGLW
jgi:hypothetical protein